MSSGLEAFRLFISSRLTAAARDIYTEFTLTDSLYQQGALTLLEDRKEGRHTPSTDDLGQYLCEEEPRWNKSRSGREEPEPPQVNEDQVEPLVKQEAEIISVTVTEDGSEVGENPDSLRSVRDFISERLIAAAGEIFDFVFQQTAIQQQKIHARPGRLGVALKPQTKLKGIDNPEQHVVKEEQLWNQEINSVLDQEGLRARQTEEDPDGPEPEPLQIKEEQEELCTNQDGEEVDAFTRIVSGEQSGPSEPMGSNISPLAPQSSMSVHMKTHTVEKPHSCVTCGKCYSHKNSLLVHIRSHTPEKPHPCVVCGKEFSFKSKLLVHMRTHTGEKPHCCVTCGKGFNQRSDLFYHIRTHTGEKPHSCVTCGKGFSKQSSLLVHLRIHTGEKPYSCVTCGKNFRQQGSLLVHMRTHTGEKPHSCLTCGKGFSQQSSLLSHMRSHTGEKPYSCIICNNKYSFKSKLVLHMRTHI